MDVFWGVVLVVLGLLAWGGQTLSAFAPGPAARMGLADAEENVAPVFWADGRGEAKWDALTLWPLLVAGVLLIVDNANWAQWGLIGGGVYTYFGGRGILARIEMRRRDHAIGSAEVRIAMTALAVWGLAGIITCILAFAELT